MARLPLPKPAQQHHQQHTTALARAPSACVNKFVYSRFINVVAAHVSSTHSMCGLRCNVRLVRTAKKYLRIPQTPAKTNHHTHTWQLCSQVLFLAHFKGRNTLTKMGAATSLEHNSSCSFHSYTFSKQQWQLVYNPKHHQTYCQAVSFS
jgi:hypothetical protein